MPAVGGVAPKFGLGPFTLENPASPILLAFFKISCPTCQLTFPFLQRLADGSELTVVGISQNDPEATREFNDAFGVRFLTVEDPAADGYRVSNAYGIEYVPSLFLVETDGSIGMTSIGFVKQDLEKLAERFLGAPLFGGGDRVPAYKPG